MYATHPEVFKLLAEVHESFDRAVHAVSTAADTWPAMFLPRAHGAYIAGVRLALSGQLPESFAQLRTAIEHSWYALHIKCDPELSVRRQLWVARIRDDAAKQTAIKAFRTGGMKKNLRKLDAALATTAEDLYERCIDHGGHPNPLAFVATMARIDGEEDSFEFTYLNVELPAQMATVKTAAEVGIAALKVFNLIYPHEFEEAALPSRLLAAIRRLQSTFGPFITKPAG